MLDIDRKNMNRVALDFENPTCLCLSPDEKTMYIGDTSGIIWAYDVASDGTLKNGREFADLPGPPYGIKVDCQSNILVALGIYGLNWYSPGGKLFGSISLPSPLNISWGGADFKSLLITCVSSIYKLRTLIPGHDVKIA
jgi:gluconolactonase